MGRNLVAALNFLAVRVLFLCRCPGAFLPNTANRGPLVDSSSLLREHHHARLKPSVSMPPATRTCRKRTRAFVRRNTRDNSGSNSNNDDSSSSSSSNSSNRNNIHVNTNLPLSSNVPHNAAPLPPPPPSPPGNPTSVLFRVLRGGTPGIQGSAASQEDELVEVSLQGGEGPTEDNVIVNDLNTPKNLGDFLFLARSSQPGSIGDELQRRGVRVFPQEAFFDTGVGGEGQEHSGLVEMEGMEGGGGQGEERGGGDSNDESMLSQFCWVAGKPLPHSTAIGKLPRDAEGRARLVLWDPCGPDHPLIQAIDGETTERASIEVLNFPTAEGGSRMREVGRERSSGGTGGSGGGGGGGDGNGDRKIFDELRSAVVFREWFDVGQQKAIADELAAQLFEDDYGEELALATDRSHVPLLQHRAALATVGDGMLAALSSDRFCREVEGRRPPVPTRVNREFNAVCYGKEAKMDKHRDTWKEWTLIVSIGSTIPFHLGSSPDCADFKLELASGEGLLFNGYELYHAVRGVKEGTAPPFWESHPLSTRGGFARVGLLSMKSFSSTGVVAPRWGPKGSAVSTDN